jgi:NADH:ubiquinone oxidoreductase subunit E
LTVQVVNGCLGVCDRAPVAKIDDSFYTHLTVESFNETLRQVIAQGKGWKATHGAQ